MKAILLLILAVFIISCEEGPVQPNIRVESEKEMLENEIKMKKRFQARSQSSRDFTKNAITKQSVRREYLKDVDELKQTKEQKIEFYLSEAIEADKIMDMPRAKQYAIKVLNLDPTDAEAKRIYNRSNRFTMLFNVGGVRDARIKRETKERMDLMKLGYKAKNNALYKGKAERGVEGFLNKQKKTVEFTEGRNGKAKIRVLKR